METYDKVMPQLILVFLRHSERADKTKELPTQEELKTKEQVPKFDPCLSVNGKTLASDVSDKISDYINSKFSLVSDD